MDINKNEIYPIEEWNITENKFSVETNYRNETTFSLSNGYIGTRGTFEEDYKFDLDTGLEGNFINGFYEQENIRYGEWNFGFPTESQSLLNLPNCKIIQLVIDNEKFDMRNGFVENYRRTLNMKEAVLSRELIWTSPKGKKVKISIRRFASFANKNLLETQYKVTPLNFNGIISFISKINGDVENHTRKTNPLVDYGPFGRHLIPDRVNVEFEELYYEGTTLNSKLSMACGCKHSLNCDYEIGQIEKNEYNCEITFEVNAVKNKEIIFEKHIIYTSSIDIEKNEMKNYILDQLYISSKNGYDNSEKMQRDYMEKLWKNTDVVIEGDNRIQQGIRFNLFHIMQSAARDGKTGMGAKGLSGEGYEGHYFWDTEMYIIPVFIYTNPELAKSLLDYRYSTLNEAKDRAKILGHNKGALYPWRTINGKEASTYFPLGTAQYHINADIAYAFKLYVDVTGNYSYLINKGAEVLCETARVWADVGCFAESRDGKYCICSVTGPDEYNAIVDNNFYTNLMARENIKDALWALEKIKEIDKNSYDNLIGKLRIENDELECWKKITDNMYFPYDEKRGIYPLDDGFMQRKPWDNSKIPIEKRHLLYENYHPLFIFRQRMSKQADAILAMYLHSNLFTIDELKKNYDFYQEVTLHHSSLSTCIFGILASQVGYHDEAYKYFCDSARMDLDDAHNNFYAGIHAANMAGTWQAIVNGFAGLRTNKGILEFNPTIPENWNGYKFRVSYNGKVVEMNIKHKGVKATLIKGANLDLYLNNKKIILLNEGDEFYEKV